MVGPQRIVIAAVGSLGDLHPHLALGRGLQRRGHQVAVAAATFHRAGIEAAGFEWRLMGPDIADEPGLFEKVMDPQTGPEFVVRHLMMPAVAESYRDLHPATRDADLVISSSLALAAPLLAEKTGLRWVSTALQPMIFLSAYEHPILTHAPRLSALGQWAGPWLGKPLMALGRKMTWPWSEPVRALRRELGLPVPGPNPLFEGQHAPSLVLALFSRSLAAPQPDWPRSAHITGPLFWDGNAAEQPVRPELQRFLDEGTPPIVFTLGSSAVYAAGNFYADSFAAAQALGRRAVLLLGPAPSNRAQLPETLPDSVLALEYAPHAQLFPRAAAIVHQGGIGTLAQAMRAGKPMLVVPFSHDQPDNAARAKRLGIAGSVMPVRYTAESAAALLRRLLDDERYRKRADEVGHAVRAETGLATACDLIERLF